MNGSAVDARRRTLGLHRRSPLNRLLWARTTDSVQASAIFSNPRLNASAKMAVSRSKRSTAGSPFLRCVKWRVKFVHRRYACPGCGGESRCLSSYALSLAPGFSYAIEQCENAVKLGSHRDGGPVCMTQTRIENG
jgi:hypothetical protein